jgi:hypothetical protein
MSSQKDMALKESPTGSPRYFKVKEETLQPMILARPSTLLTLLTRTNLDVAMLILKLDTASKHKNKPPK